MKLTFSFIIILVVLFLNCCTYNRFLKESDIRIEHEIDPVKLISEIDIDDIDEIHINYFFPKDINYSGSSIRDPLNNDSLNFCEKELRFNFDDIESNEIFINNYIKELLGLIIRNKQFEEENLAKKVVTDKTNYLTYKGDFVDNKEKILQSFNNSKYKYQSCEIVLFLEFGGIFKYFPQIFMNRRPIVIQVYTSKDDIAILIMDLNYGPNDIIVISYSEYFSRFVFEEEHYRLVYNLINYKNNQLRSEHDNENIQNLELYNIEDVMLPYYIEKFKR